MIVVRMVFPGQLPICLFYFIIRGGFRHAQNLIGIIHVASSTSLLFFLSFPDVRE